MALHPKGEGFQVQGSAHTPVIDPKAEGPDASDSRRNALLKGINSFDVATGGGPTGLRPQHLREIVLQGEATGLCGLLDGL